MALTIGGSGINSSMFAGVPSAQNNSHLGMYQNNAAGEPERQAQGNVDMENNGEDLLMMNIPREGNADQLNKSTKLTLSSKK
jgi:hypothetical protein